MWPISMPVKAARAPTAAKPSRSPARTGSSFDAGEPSPRGGLSTGWIIFIVLASIGMLVLVCGGILTALLLPAVQAAREAARSIACTNNMKQIGLAIHNYAQANRCLPPAYVADKKGKPLYSWRVLILPYLKGDSLYQQFRLDEPWDSPHNLPLASVLPMCFICPTAMGASGGSTTCYAMIVGPHAIGNGAKPRHFSDIKDGSANTIMVVEAVGAHLPWSAPRDIDIADADSIQAGIDANSSMAKGLSSCHPFGVNVLFCDGSVRFINATIDRKILKAMLTIDGGEQINMQMDGY